MLIIILDATALLVAIPTFVLLVEVVLGVIGREALPPPRGQRRRLAVVVPAHNEATTIALALRSIRSQLLGGDRVLVVADNCTDSTAMVAEAEGAEVVVRVDPARRGKGYALDFGVRYLEKDAPEIVVIVDADCVVTENTIDRLARSCSDTSRPVQALYLMRAAQTGDSKVRIAEFAYVVKNLVRPLGLHRLGLPCQLMGTGMAFEWSCISGIDLATGHIVEDLKLGIDLALRGLPPVFCPDALVLSDFPSSAEGMRGQRTRWEHGHLGVIITDGPRLLRKALTLPLNTGLLAMAFDLCVPPLALLILQIFSIWILGLILYAFTRISMPLEIASATAAMATLAVVMSWSRHGRQIISLGGLLLSIPYVASKIHIYAKFLVARQLDWVRSKRD